MIAIHKFLLVVAAPFAVGGIDVVKSLHEIFRVAAKEAAIMAIHDGVLVATMGLMKATWWYNGKEYLTDRWHFCLPTFWHGPADKALMSEAMQIAEFARLPFVHNGKLRDARGGVLRLRRNLYNSEGQEA